MKEREQKSGKAAGNRSPRRSDGVKAGTSARRRHAYDARDYEPEPMEIVIEEYEEDSGSGRKPVSGPNPKSRNSFFARVTYLFVALFLCLMGYIVYFNIVEGPEIVNSAYNPRSNLYADRVSKGMILDINGNVLAENRETDDGTTYRYYPYGSVFAHVVGYDTNGKSGIESAENTTLLTSSAFIGERLLNEIKDQKNIGDNVYTTLDADLQQAAYNALGDHKGAVIAIEPSTGAIKAIVSKPDFEPNNIDSNWDDLNNDEENSPLLNRATQGLYPPGSVFKILTSLEFIKEDADYASYSYECQGSITEGETTISCFNGTVHGTEDLTDSFAYSCNSSYANIGENLDASAFRETAEELLFNQDLECPLPAAVTSFTLDRTAGYATKMMTAMGQGETLTSPYHMALIACAIANGGTLMKPYLVDHVENYSGSTVRSTSVQTYGKLMTTQEAGVLTELMKAVTAYGTASELSACEYSVAGKTGTAEYSDDKEKSHSWFVGFSNVDNPDLVVAVVMEGYDGNAEARAIPVAKQVFDAYYY